MIRIHVLAVVALAGSVFAQGPLAPTAGPGPTFKTLTQIEPRIPISSVPVTLSVRGSYYLTTNLFGVAFSNGITLATDDITIDLNGFSLVGVPTSLDGISTVVTPENVTIKNGVVRGWGDRGVDLSNAEGALLVDVKVVENGDDGALLGNSCHIVGCHSRGNGDNGFNLGNAVVAENCVAIDNSGDGFVLGAEPVVHDCLATRNLGFGFSSAIGGKFSQCVANDNIYGFWLFSENVLQGCVASYNTNVGMSVGSQSVIEHCTANSNGRGAVTNGAGFELNGENCRLTDNTSVGNDVGIRVTSVFGNNDIAGNVVMGNAESYVLTSSNKLQLLVSELPETIPWPAQVTLAGTLRGIPGANGITVASSDVTIDLGGQALIGVPGALSGINCSGISNLVVRNGTVRGWSTNGISAASVVGARYEDLILMENGGHGLDGGRRVVVENVVARDNGNDGIYIRNGGTLSHCVAHTNAQGGIDVDASGVIRECEADGNFIGFDIAAASLIENCVAQDNLYGIFAIADCVIRDNNCRQNETGINVTAGDNRIEGNSLADNDTGLRVGTGVSGNFIVKNTASGSTTNYGIAAGNAVGAIENVIGLVGFTNVSPWANFEY